MLKEHFPGVRLSHDVCAVEALPDVCSISSLYIFSGCAVEILEMHVCRIQSCWWLGFLVLMCQGLVCGEGWMVRYV